MDVFRPTVEFISGPDDPGADFCVMRGVLPPVPDRGCPRSVRVAAERKAGTIKVVIEP